MGAREKKVEQRVRLSDEEAQFLEEVKRRAGLHYAADAIRWCIRRAKRQLNESNRRKMAAG
jgi:hypothetical protein